MLLLCILKPLSQGRAIASVSMNIAMRKLVRDFNASTWSFELFQTPD